MTPTLRTRIWAVLGVTIAVSAIALLLVFGLGHRGALTASPLVHRQAPDFTLPALDGHGEKPLELAALRGHVVVVNFWASWCGECHTEQAALNQTWQRFRDAGVVVAGVNFQDAPGDAREYVASAGISYPIGVDSKSTAALAYGLRGVPETYLIDAHGQLVERFVGPVSAAKLAERITGLIDAPSR